MNQAYTTLSTNNINSLWLKVEGKYINRIRDKEIDNYCLVNKIMVLYKVMHYL